MPNTALVVLLSMASEDKGMMMAIEVVK